MPPLAAGMGAISLLSEGSGPIAAELHIAAQGNAPRPVRLSSDAVQVRKEILGQARIGHARLASIEVEQGVASKTYSTQVWGDLVWFMT